MAGKKKDPRLKDVKAGTKTIVVGEAGDIKETQTEYSYKVPVEPSFVKTYLEDIGRMRNCSKGEIDVLFELLKIMDYQNQLVLPAGIKNMIAQGMQLKNANWVNVCVTSLTKKGVLIKLGSGLYLVNPDLFAKGNWKEIREIQLRVTYDKDGRQTKTLMQREVPNDIDKN